MCSADCPLFLLAILFPPLPVWIKKGLCSADSFINIALCMLAFIPGLIHSWYIILYTEPDHYEVGTGYQAVGQEDPERGDNVSYYYVNVPPPQRPSSTPAGDAYGNRNYGTTAPPQQGHSSRSQQQAEPDNDEVPPTYNEAIKGDHKAQTPA